jgi:Icc-related predicted phosphoesterase
MQYMSDLHLEFEEYLPKPVDSTLLLAGDILTYKTYRNNKRKRKRYDAFLDHVSKEWDNVVIILGNHEYYGWNGNVENFLRSLYESYGLHFLENDVVTVDNVRVAGTCLWTDFFGDKQYYHDVVSRGMNDYHVTGLTTRMTYNKHMKARDFLLNAKADVVVTHHAPSVESVHTKYLGSPLNAGYYSDLYDFIGEIKPKVWVHGHMHHPVDYMIANTRVLANPRGYPHENNNFDETRTFNAS